MYRLDALTFRFGNFTIKDGRRNEVDEEELKDGIECDRPVSVREVADKLLVSHTTIERHLKELVLLKKFWLKIAIY